MTDYSALRRLAHEASETEMGWLDRDWLSGIMADDWADYVAAIEPQVVIDLIDESANARRTSAFWKDEKICADAVIDQLKAENEALRKDAKDGARWKRALLWFVMGGAFHTARKPLWIMPIIDAAMGKGEQA